MNPAFPSALSDLGVQHHYAYPTSDPESTQGSSGSGKKRASRAGTRSVSTLSAAQLDRKRANDREAQRAIRQRTKDHIEHLEKTISELRAAQEASDKLLAATQQRNREFEEENAYLRAKLNEAGVGYPLDPPQAAAPDAQEHPEASARSSSAATHASASSSIPSAPPVPPMQSGLSIVPPQMARTQSGFWQQQQSSLVQVQSAPATLHDPTSTPMAPHLTNWRSHDGSQSMHGTPSAVPDSSHDQPQPAAQPTSIVSQYPPWPAPQPHTYHGHVLVNKREATPHQEQQFAQATPSMYSPPQPRVQQPAYPPPVPNPTPPAQAAYHAVHVSSPVVYQVNAQQPQQPVTHPTQYQIGSGHASPAMISSAFPPQQMHVDSQSAIAQSYNDGHPGQQYGQQLQHAIPYRADSMGSQHPTSHYQNS